jgi:hypothetical protein
MDRVKDISAADRGDVTPRPAKYDGTALKG